MGHQKMWIFKAIIRMKVLRAQGKLAKKAYLVLYRILFIYFKYLHLWFAILLSSQLGT